MATSKLKYGIIGTLLLATIATIAVLVFVRARTKLPPMPNPNGYEFFVRAAQALPAAVSDYREMSPAALRTLVGQDAAALALARQGFGYECRVADNYATNLTDLLPRLKSLNYAFGAEGRLAELDQRPADAVHSYLDDLRYGQEASRGGTLIFRLVGIAIETIALRSLAPLTNSAEAGLCKATAAVLENLDAKEPSIAETLEQENAYFHRNLGLRDLIPGVQAMQRKMVAPVLKSAVGKFQTNEFALRQTMIAFAARAYELEHKQPPKSVGDLAPDYLKAIPPDPRTGNAVTTTP